MYLLRRRNQHHLDTVQWKLGTKILRFSATVFLEDYVMREFNHYVHDGKARLKAFPGATAKHLHHYSLPTLKEDHPDTVIVHVGFNDLSPKDGNLEFVNTEEVSKEIIEIGRTCVKHVATSSLYRVLFVTEIIESNS